MDTPKQPEPRRSIAIDLAKSADGRGKGVGTLGPILAWALVFADVGTAVYYVPGVLYRQVGGLASAFVLLTTFAFVIVALEHLEVAHRYPDGGGGIAAAVEAFGPRAGVLSGAFLVSAYLLTIAISVVTAIHYLATLGLPWPSTLVALSALFIGLLGAWGWVGVRSIARLIAIAALAAVAVDVVLITSVALHLSPAEWVDLFDNVLHPLRLGWADAATGFTGAWLAYSGLETLGQLAPSVREPRRRTIRIATALVIGSVLLTVPLFAALAVEAATAGKIGSHSAMLAAVAASFGGHRLHIAVAVTGAVLLLLAAKVAFLGCYHVFREVGEHGYLPAAIARSQSAHAAPRGAVIVITAGAIALVVGTRADPRMLANLFAFGLLGSYTITSVSLDVLRWREGRRGLSFWLGVLATLAVVVPWVVSWLTKLNATLYGAAVAGLFLSVAFVTRKGWIRSGRFGFLKASRAEESAADLSTALEVLTLNEAEALKQSYPSSTLLAVRGSNPRLCAEASRRARGLGDAAVYVLFVDEIPGFLFPPRRGPSAEALRVLRAAVRDLRTHGIDAVPIWRLAHDAGASIAEAAEKLGASCVMLGTTHRSAVSHFLQGSVLKRLVAELPEPVHVVICE